MKAPISLFLFIVRYTSLYLFSISLIWIIISLFIECAIYIVEKNDYLILYLFLIIQMALFIPYIIDRETQYSFQPHHYGEITSISGSVVFDSTLSENGNTVVTVKADALKSSHSISLYKRIEILSIIKGSNYLRAGSKVSLSGHFIPSDDHTSLFIVTSYKITHRSKGLLLREKIQEYIMGRIENVDDKVKELILLVTLGIKGEKAYIITKSASIKGVAHLFALSGMHLSILISLFLTFFSKVFSKKWGVFLSLLVAFFYLFIAGNKPSLMRSVLSLFVSMVPFIHTKEDRFMCVIIIHSLMFPSSMMALAALYSYVAIYAILTISSLFSRLLEVYLPHVIASSLSLSISAMGLTGVISLFIFNSFHPIGILYTLILTPLIIIFLTMSIISIAITIEFIQKGVEMIGGLIYSILESQVLPLSVINPWIIFSLTIVLFLTLSTVLWYSHFTIHSRKTLTYEMDLCLRLPNSDKSTP
ncbi:MAG: hypothetical protein EOM67_02935 [Spirochaetia bacterium]|nr:hypothetical protein [Spirochaetia bacterium]